MRHLASSRATRSILGTWASLLVLFFAVAPGLHVHSCDSGHLAAGDDVVAFANPFHDDHAPATDAGRTPHDCDVCRLLSQTGALAPDTAIGTVVVAASRSDARPVVPATGHEVLADDLGRGPPAHAR